MPELFKKVTQAFAKPSKEVEFKPVSALDRLAKQGIRPVIMTDQLENRIALITNLRKILDDIYNGTSLEQQLKAIDRALPLCIIVSQPWGRGHEVWTKFSAQFRELRTMPAFMDSLIEEFLDMINHGWIPEDVLTPVPIVMITPQAPRQPLDLHEFEVATKPPVEKSTPRETE